MYISKNVDEIFPFTAIFVSCVTHDLDMISLGNLPETGWVCYLLSCVPCWPIASSGTYSGTLSILTNTRYTPHSSFSRRLRNSSKLLAKNLLTAHTAPTARKKTDVLWQDSRISEPIISRSERSKQHEKKDDFRKVSWEIRHNRIARRTRAVYRREGMFGKTAERVCSLAWYTLHTAPATQQRRETLCAAVAASYIQNTSDARARRKVTKPMLGGVTPFSLYYSEYGPLTRVVLSFTLKWSTTTVGWCRATNKRIPGGGVVNYTYRDLHRNRNSILVV